MYQPEHVGKAQRNPSVPQAPEGPGFTHKGAKGRDRQRQWERARLKERWEDGARQGRAGQAKCKAGKAGLSAAKSTECRTASWASACRERRPHHHQRAGWNEHSAIHGVSVCWTTARWSRSALSNGEGSVQRQEDTSLTQSSPSTAAAGLS